MSVASLRRGFLWLSSNSTIPPPSPLPNPPVLSSSIALRFFSVRSSEDYSPTVSLLVESLGFPPETAESVLRKLRYKNPRNADSVISFLKSRDFSATQISEMIRRHPPLLGMNPDSILMPKLDFFQSKGLLRSDLAELLSSYPQALGRSLERSIIPNFNFVRGLLKSDMKALQLVIRLSWSGQQKVTVVPNLKYLVDNGVSESNVASILQYHPDKLYAGRARFREAMRVLKEMGLDPKKTTFRHALGAVLGMSKSSWDSKAGVYRKWGWSEEELLLAFRKFPLCMTASEDKINRFMSLFVDRMGWEPSLIADNPALMTMSFEKRIFPRALVRQFLLSKHLVDKRYGLANFFVMNDKNFIKRISGYSEVAPRVLAIYKEALNNPS